MARGPAGEGRGLAPDRQLGREVVDPLAQQHQPVGRSARIARKWRSSVWTSSTWSSAKR